MNNSESTDFVLKRRDFLLIISGLLVLAPSGLLASEQKQTLDAYAEEPWKTLDAVFEHMFPAIDGAPGSRDIGVIHYIQTMLQTPDADPQDKIFITNGVGWLNDLSQNKHNQNFISLDTATKENLLRQIENSQAGERWLSLLLTNLLEALLSDPVYGSNPNGIGWNWLQHTAGFPLPDADTQYYKLSRRVSRNIKA